MNGLRHCVARYRRWNIRVCAKNSIPFLSDVFSFTSVNFKG